MIKKTTSYYQLLVLTVYLISITATKSMDITLPIYIIFSVFPYIGGKRQFDFFSLFYLIILGVYLIYGIIVQDFRASIVTCAGKFFQFITLIIFYKNNKTSKLIGETKKIVFFAVIVETIIGFFLLFNGTLISETGLMRITAGAQPVGGNIAVAIIPIIIYGYFHENESKEIIVRLSYILLVWTILSGTRGYMLVFGAAILPIYIDYWFRYKKNKLKRVLVIIIIITILIIFISLKMEYVTDLFFRLTRINISTGIRDYENAVVKRFFVNTSWPYKLLGIGFGNKLHDVPGYNEAVEYYLSSFVGERSQYANAVGAPFHNLFSDIILTQGLLGLVLIMGVFVWGCSKIKKCNIISKSERTCYLLFYAGFFIMNYFRWSCDCGITEMIFFALVINRVLEVDAHDVLDKPIL